MSEGWRWHDDGLYWCREWEEEDSASEETMEDRSSRLILDSMNAPMGFLIFTKESPSDFEDGKLPTLDIKIWIDNIHLVYVLPEAYEQQHCHPGKVSTE